MFTPPQSPLPTADDPLAAAGAPAVGSAHAKAPPRGTGRVQRSIALVVPVLVLVLISVTTSYSVYEPSIAQPPSPSARAHRLHHLPRQLNSSATPTASAPGTTTPQEPGPNPAPGIAPAIPSTPWPVPTPFPQALDSSLPYNFSTTTCGDFFTDFKNNMTFRTCRPMSLLPSTSAAFYKIQANLTELTATVAGTCNTPQSVDQCRQTMGWLASEIAKPTVCGTELAARNPIVMEAHDGFRNYDLMRQAGCLVNQRSNAYCFVEAIASTSPSDTYFFSLPLGTPVPAKSVPSCSACIKSLMALYADYATDKTLPLSKVYPAAQKLATNSCGEGYAVAVANAATHKVGAPWLLGPVFGLSLGIWSLLI